MSHIKLLIAVTLAGSCLSLPAHAQQYQGRISRSATAAGQAGYAAQAGTYDNGGDQSSPNSQPRSSGQQPIIINNYIYGGAPSAAMSVPSWTPWDPPREGLLDPDFHAPPVVHDDSLQKMLVQGDIADNSRSLANTLGVQTAGALYGMAKNPDGTVQPGMWGAVGAALQGANATMPMGGIYPGMPFGPSQNGSDNSGLNSAYQNGYLAGSGQITPSPSNTSSTSTKSTAQHR